MHKTCCVWCKYTTFEADNANKRKNFEIEKAGRSDAFHGKECRESTRKRSRRKRKKAPNKDAFLVK